NGLPLPPFPSIKYLQETLLPNVERGLTKSGRTRADLTLATTAFVITGRTREALERAKDPVRTQIAFYASTRTYIGVLEAHGWGETCYRLSEKAAKGDWGGMASLITDEMLDVYAVQGTWDELAGLLRKKYAGGIDRLGFTALPGVAPAAEGARRALINATRGGVAERAPARRPRSASRRPRRRRVAPAPRRES